MPEHICEWVGFTSIANYPVKGSNPPTVYACKHCFKEMKFQEVERRLNATEKLSAELALQISGELVGYEYALDAYAAALEKD